VYQEKSGNPGMYLVKGGQQNLKKSEMKKYVETKMSEQVFFSLCCRFLPR
jgi:hypothetical protein